MLLGHFHLSLYRLLQFLKALQCMPQCTIDSFQFLLGDYGSGAPVRLF